MSHDSDAPSRRGGIVQLVFAVLGTVGLGVVIGHPGLGTARGMAMFVAAATVVGALYYAGVRALRQGRAGDEG